MCAILAAKPTIGTNTIELTRTQQAGILLFFMNVVTWVQDNQLNSIVIASAIAIIVIAIIVSVVISWV